MEVKFEEIDKYEHSTDFLKKDKIAEIIKSSYNLKLSYRYDEWKLFSNYKLLNDIVDELFNIMKDKWDYYDYLGSLGSSGAPLTYLLSVKYKKDAIFINDDWGVTGLFQPIKPYDTKVKDKKILLVDSVFESGLTACNGIEILKKSARKDNGIVIVDVLVITYFPNYTDQTFVKTYKDSTLYYLYYCNKNVVKEAKEKGIVQ